MAKFKVVLGKDWELEAKVEGEDGEPQGLIDTIEKLRSSELKKKEVVSRLTLAGAIVVVLFLALSVATVWGWLNGDFSGLRQIWTAGSVPLGWVAGYYFGKDGS